MKHLKKFETAVAYNAATLDLPNVSLIEENMSVSYNPWVDPYAGHDYVEIGGRKWATMNIGANSITDTGLYFQWGDTQGYTADQIGSGEVQKYFSWEDYKYGNGTSDPGTTGITKYNATDGKTVLETSDDAAQANWGGQWRMPTSDEFMALGAATNYEWIENYQGTSINGILLTDKTDSSKVLFFPACSFCRNGSIRSVNNEGDYWYSFLDTSSMDKAAGFSFYIMFVGETKRFIADWKNYHYRYYGYTVRPVAS